MNERFEMMRRVYGLSAAVLCIVLASVMFAGCFGSGDEPSTVSSETTVSTASDTTSETSSESTTTSVEQTTTTETFDLVDGLPRAYVESYRQRPIVVLFYVPGGVEDEKVLQAIKESQAAYGSYTFLIFDYRVPAAYGDLSKSLSVGYPPYTVLFDRHGEVRTVWEGFVDKGTLNQTLINLGKY